MITEKQVIDFLKTKSKQYRDHFIESVLLYSNCNDDACTIADEAHFLNVSKTTCFFMRHKLYSAATEIISQQLLSGSIELDTEYLKINRKGTKPKNMPRISKKRGNSSAFRGISHHKISVVCAVDSNDHMIMKVTGLGAESFDKYKKTENYFKDVKKIISDSKTSIQPFANLLNAKNDKIPTSPIQMRYQHDRKTI